MAPRRAPSRPTSPTRTATSSPAAGTVAGVERATSTEPKRIDGIGGLALELNVSPGTVRRLATRKRDPLPVLYDERGAFMMTDELAGWRARQRRSYLEARALGLVPNVQATG